MYISRADSRDIAEIVTDDSMSRTGPDEDA